MGSQTTISVVGCSSGVNLAIPFSCGLISCEVIGVSAGFPPHVVRRESPSRVPVRLHDGPYPSGVGMAAPGSVPCAHLRRGAAPGFALPHRLTQGGDGRWRQGDPPRTVGGALDVVQLARCTPVRNGADIDLQQLSGRAGRIAPITPWPRGTGLWPLGTACR